MKTLWKGSVKQRVFAALMPAALFLFAAASTGQTLTPRIAEEIDNARRSSLPGTHPPRAQVQNDAGRVPGDTSLSGIKIVFSRSAAQEADLQALIAAQQDPNSPQYHHWLTTSEFAARFGMADEDINKVEFWLQQQGFTVESISPSKNQITFSGNASLVESALQTEMHYYTIEGRKEYAPAADVTIPTALRGVVKTITNLSTIRPKPHVKFHAPQRAVKSDFTSSQTSNHFLTPADVATIYDITAAYNAGYTGSGEKIAVVGQSSVVTTDIEHFETAAGQSIKDPNLILVPNSGTATIVSGDEAESDLDLEYSSTIAKSATIYFVYVGNNPNYNVFDALTYAIDNETAPVISISYGACEATLSSAEYASLNGVLAQAAAQGQSVIAAAGDNGSTDCSRTSGLSTTQQEALAVDFPASSQYVTAMGGTEFPAADVVSTNTTYWEPTSGTDVISSALSYIPEQAWNDDSATNGISSGGGGASTLTARPSWQTGVTGIPSGSFRLVPDISLSASPENAGYLYCSSDTKSTGITGSCSNGFRDSSDTYLTVAGGTSFDVPIFASMVAMINQKTDSTGQGVASKTLYQLAANATTYGSAFHDITNGGNQCTAGASYCSSAGESEFLSTTGYDEATGLGSVDFYNLLTAWPAGTNSTLAASTILLSAATTTPNSGASDVITITVASGSSSVTSVPTGTLTIMVDGTTETGSLALVNGGATYTFSSTTMGSHTVAANYSGDSVFGPSSGIVTLTVTTSTKTFTVTATNVTVASGNSGTSTVTVIPNNGYTGTVAWTVSAPSSLLDACYVLANTSVSGTSAVTTSLTINTNSTACANATALTSGGGVRRFVGSGSVRGGVRGYPVYSTVAMVSFLGIGLLGLWIPKTRMFGVFFFLLAVGGGITGCGGSSSSKTSETSSTNSTASNSTNAPTGTYMLTIVGTDTTSSSIAASTTITLTID
jgi:subtilase family serine protease